MTCDEIRSRLMVVEGPVPASEPIAAHLEECAACREFAGRLELARDALRAHASDHQPDPLFARRVSAALPSGPDLLGWAALRLLPATLGLALALSACCWLATPAPGELVEPSPTDDLLAWALSEDGS